MIALLNALSSRARLAASVLILGLFGLLVLAPVGFGLSAFIGAQQDYHQARSATQAIERRVTAFNEDRAAFQRERALGDSALERLLDGEANDAGFREELLAFAEALREAGISVSGETRVLERSLAGGGVLLSADVSVAGPLSDILTVLSQPDFARLRAEGASFAAQSGDGQVRGSLRLVSHHLAPELEGGP